MGKFTVDKPFIHSNCSITDTRLGAFVEIGEGSRLNNVRMGDYSYCDRFSDFANAKIGKFANIASFVRIGATDHPLDRASLHHFMYRSQDYWPTASADEKWFAKRKARVTFIGHDTWIGHNAQIKPELHIGHGAVIASGAVVTKDVQSYTIVAGVPAKPLRRRFSEHHAERMIALAWWHWKHEKLRSALDDFRNISVEAFLEKYE